MVKFEIKKAVDETHLEECLLIRKKVFIEEQGVTPAEERDGLDDQSDHYLLEKEEVPIATARVRYIEDKAKIERVAVLAEFRGRGYGQNIMKYIIKEIISSQRVKKILLGAQNHAIPFYKDIGFVECGEEYIDAGIPHKDMMMSIE